MVAIAVGTVVLACRDIATQPPPSPPTPGVYTFGGPTPPASPAVPPVVGQRRRRGSPALPEPGQPRGSDPAAARRRPVKIRATGSTSTCSVGLSGRRAIGMARSRATCRPPASTPGRTAWSTPRRSRRWAAPRRPQRSSRRLLVAQPGSAIVEEGLSRIYYNRGEFDKAVTLLGSVAARTRDPVVMQQLAYAAEKTGDRERAISTYRDVLSAQPRADVARGLLAESLLAAGRGNEALSVLQEGLQRHRKPRCSSAAWAACSSAAAVRPRPRPRTVSTPGSPRARRTPPRSPRARPGWSPRSRGRRCARSSVARCSC